MCKKSSDAAAVAASMTAMPCHIIGDALHIVLLAGIAIYGTAISQLIKKSDDSVKKWPSFDSDWLQHGFCMPHDEVPFLSTHERSGFFLIAISILGFGIIRSLNDTSGKMRCAKKRVTWAFFGAIGHGFGHIILAITKRNGLLPSGEVSAMDEFLSPDSSFVTFAKHVPGYFIFQIPLVKSYMYNVSNHHVASFAFLMMIGAMQLPLKFGFSYTLIVLFAGQSLDQLFLPKTEKGFEYMLWPMLTLLPNFCISVMESTLCTESLAFKTHGHLIFDGYMALSYIIYYLVCWFWNNYINLRVKKRL